MFRLPLARRITSTSSEGAATWAFGRTQGSATGEFSNPGYLALDVSGTSEQVIVGDTGNNRAQRFDLVGAFQGAFGQGGQPGGLFGNLQDIALEADGNWYVTDTNLSRVQEFICEDGLGNPWYDAVGNRTAADVTSNEHHTYGYDVNNLDRLLNVDRPQTSNDESYTYDEVGNRLSSRQYANWTYDPANDELHTWDAVRYTSDGAGNRATKTDAAGTTTYTYDYENRLVRVDLPGGLWVTYDYDSLGRRVRKNSNGTETLFWYEGEDIVVETSAAGTEEARYTHGPGIDSPLKVRRGSNSYYYHEDALGSIVLMTNASKNSSKTYKYDAFGNVYNQTGSVTNFYQYTGREWDSESALYYYRARTYDPKVGRFLQQDPIPPRPEEMNAYVYVRNNPLRFIDPFGLKVWNRGRTPVIIKPEKEGAKPIVLGPGGRYDGEQDGVYPYYWSADRAVFKNIDGLDVTITESGDYLVSGGAPGDYAAQAAIGGWKDEAFLKANEDWPSREEADKKLRQGPGPGGPCE